MQSENKNHSSSGAKPPRSHKSRISTSTLDISSKSRKRLKKLQEKLSDSEGDGSQSFINSDEESKNSNNLRNQKRISKDVIEALRKITKNFSLTFKDIKDSI